MTAGKTTTLWAPLAALAVVAAAVAFGGGLAAPSPAAAAPAAASAGRFVWHDLLTRDAAACRTFYGALLGWEWSQTTREGHPYFLARSGGAFVGGMVPIESAGTSPAAWLGYLSVPDLDRAVELVGSSGGKVLAPPRAVGAYGRVAVVSDPQGAPIGLAGVSVELPGEPATPRVHHFFWMEHLARDAGAALAFYKTLAGFGSTVHTLPSGGEYHVLETDRPRAGLFQIPADATMIDPNWLPHVRVEDPAALAAKAESLGGKVLLRPRPELRGGTVAVVADPTGGAFALQKWPL